MLRWSLPQLFKYNNKQFTFSDVLSLKDRITDVSDIIDISEVKVSGYGKCVYGDRYLFKMHIECLLTLECARTLDEVPFPISIDCEEVYDTFIKDDDEDVRLIEKNTVDLTDAIWENIYLEKPMRVVKEGSKEFIDDQNFDDFYNDK